MFKCNNNNNNNLKTWFTKNKFTKQVYQISQFFQVYFRFMSDLLSVDLVQNTSDYLK